LAPSLAMTFVLSLVLTACGFNVQTNLPYTPADGVNLNIGTVSVRNLMVLSRQPGQGYVSASMASSGQDSLVGVSGTVIKSDGSEGAQFNATVPAPVNLTNGVAVVLTDDPAFITIQADGLDAGLTANLTLEFSKAGQATVKVPVIDGLHPYYATVTPSAAPNATPSS
jgi:hypothetical protein